MNETIVVNTSPLIAWGKMNILEVISQLPIRLICPAQVKSEITMGTDLGYPVSFPNFVEVKTLKSRLSALSLANLDAGEAAVIELALEQNITVVCLDELKGRRAALAAGLQVVGSLGLLGRAKTLGLIPDLRAVIEKAEGLGIYYDAKLVEKFLNGMGE